MIAMDYSFTLPADYDMEIIDRRIREKGPSLDGFPQLRFKAYLSAKKRDVGFASAENLYAPFYLWDEPEGIGNFLAKPGFAALARDFGWPSVQTWLVWQAHLDSRLGAARYASRELYRISPYADVTEQREMALSDAHSAVKAGALATVAAFDPATWRRLQFCLWPMVPETTDRAQTFTVGYVSLPWGSGEDLGSSVIATAIPG